MTKITTRTLPGFLTERGIGFDRMFDLFDETVARAGTQSYPPYNLIKMSDTAYLVEVAIAGFAESNLSVTVEGNRLTIVGEQETERDSESYLHRGISTRSFTREFVLADNMVVLGASVADGILSINLEREIPEAKKARTIEINR